MKVFALGLFAKPLTGHPKNKRATANLSILLSTRPA